MLVLTEGRLTFTFPANWRGGKYDDWLHYRKQFIKARPGINSVDFVVVEPGSCCWLIEVKDYRIHRRTKPVELADEMADKVIDTLAGLASAQVRAADDAERLIARQALRTTDIRVVLHLEQPSRPSKLFPTAANPVAVLEGLTRRIRSIDPHPLVVQQSRMGNLPWTVQ